MKRWASQCKIWHTLDMDTRKLPIYLDFLCKQSVSNILQGCFLLNAINFFHFYRRQYPRMFLSQPLHECRENNDYSLDYCGFMNIFDNKTGMNHFWLSDNNKVLPPVTLLTRHYIYPEFFDESKIKIIFIFSKKSWVRILQIVI